MTNLDECLLRLGIDRTSPSTMGELEVALGIQLTQADLAMNDMGLFSLRGALVGDLRAVSARYDWDMYHQHPVVSLDRLRSHRLLEFTLHLVRGRDAIEGALSRRFGAARPVASCLVYERWILEPAPGDACSLSFHVKLPEWAVRAADPALREQFLVELFHAAAAATPDDLARVASAAPPSAGVVFRGQSRRGVDLEFDPAIAAIELARLLGWDKAVCQSGDVHQSSWSIVCTGKGGERWKLEATLEGRPKGSKVVEEFGPPGGRYFLCPEDRVRYFSFTRR